MTQFLKQKKYVRKSDGGAAMILAVIFFLFISSTIVLGIINPILQQAKAAMDLLHSKESYFLAEGGLEDAVYRLKVGNAVATGDTLALNGGSATITLTQTPSGQTVTSSANRLGFIRKMEAQVIAGVTGSLSYAVQAGVGGFTLNTGSSVHGSAYANSDIRATGGVSISGSASAATAGLALNQSNGDSSAGAPPSSMSFRNTASTQDFAQSFQVTSNLSLNKLSLYMKKVGNPSDATVRIVSDNAGEPSTTDAVGATGVLSSESIGSDFGWVDVPFPSNTGLHPGTTYWLVIDSNFQSAATYYVIAGNSSYSNGAAKIGKLGVSWNDASADGPLDAYFQVYVGSGGVYSILGGDSYIGGVTIGTGATGDAWAHDVVGARVMGNLFCQIGGNNDKSCNMGRSDPPVLAYPTLNSNVAWWKAEAAAGGITSDDVAVGASGANFGSKQITGNLTVSDGGTLTLSGTLWVQGKVVVSGGGKIKLAGSYGANSGVLLSDKYVSVTGGTLSGSGIAGSYLLVFVTSNCPADVSACLGNDAISTTNVSGSSIFDAPNGTANLSGVSTKAVIARNVMMTSGSSANYENALANLSFVSGGSGGWSISSWTEVQ